MANKQIKDYTGQATAARGDLVFTQTSDLTKYNAPTVATILGLLSGDDLPTMPVSKGGTNVTSLTASRILKSAADGLSVGTLTGTGFLKLTSDVPSVAALARADMPTGALFTDAAISSTAQYIEDKDGNASALALSSSNVGIGTTSPADQLYGTMGLSIYHSIYPSVSLGNSTSDWMCWVIGSNFNLYSSAVSGDVLTVNTSGNVGIGTSSPGAKLHVNGNIRCVLPTSSSGLSSGDLWNDGGIVKIVT